MESDTAPVNYRWQAFRLSALSYLLAGDAVSARKSALEFLRINPTYSSNVVSDSREFRSILQTLVVIPKFSIGIAATAGSNITFPRIINSYSISAYDKTYKSIGSYQFGIQIGYTLSENFALNLGISNTGKAFKTEYTVNPWSYQVNEKMQFLEFPLTARYSFYKNRRLRPYAQAGVYYGHLSSSYNDFYRTSSDALENSSAVHLSSIDRRQRNHIGALCGFGFFYKLWKGHINLEFDAYQGFTNITDDRVRYDFLDLTQRFEYVDDDMKLSNLMVSLGYTYYINYRIKERGK
jgi:opacity protein-like surface antigen